MSPLQSGRFANRRKGILALSETSSFYGKTQRNKQVRFPRKFSQITAKFFNLKLAVVDIPKFVSSDNVNKCAIT